MDEFQNIDAIDTLDRTLKQATGSVAALQASYSGRESEMSHALSPQEMEGALWLISEALDRARGAAIQISGEITKKN